MEHTYDVTIVGAGIAGLAAARELSTAGLRTLILDKGRQVGGRMATRRLQEAAFDTGSRSAAFDTGAQFFTAVSPEFRTLVEAAAEEHATAQWYQRPPRKENETPLPVWRGTTGMTDLPKWIAAGLRQTETIELRTTTRVGRIAATPDAVQIFMEPEEQDAISTGVVILTPPAPQSLELLPRDLLDHMASSEMARGITDIRYDPCLALLIALDSSLSEILNEHGWFRPSGTDGVIAWVADNARKMHPEARGELPARLTVHTTAAAAVRLYQEEESKIVAELMDALMALVPARKRGTVERALAQGAIDLKKWRYARPTRRWSELSAAIAPNVFLAGDSFGGGRVEGAFTSGRHAAGRILARNG